MAELPSRESSKEFLLWKVQEHSSGIAREFWRGKLAQLHAPLSAGEDTTVCHESCLSPSVRSLLSRPLVPPSRREGGRFLKADLTLNWEEVGTHLAEGE